MKKVLALGMVVVSCVMALSSCSSVFTKDPLDLARKFDEDDYLVKVAIDDEDIADFADEFDLNGRDVDCIVVAVPDDGDDYDEMVVFLVVFSSLAIDIGV